MPVSIHAECNGAFFACWKSDRAVDKWGDPCWTAYIFLGNDIDVTCFQCIRKYIKDGQMDLDPTMLDIDYRTLTSHDMPFAFGNDWGWPCACCGVMKQSMNKCSACHAVRYCSGKCQRLHWKRHGHKEKCQCLSIYKQAKKDTTLSGMLDRGEFFFGPISTYQFSIIKHLFEQTAPRAECTEPAPVGLKDAVNLSWLRKNSGEESKIVLLRS